jgi:hypothetical protein
MAKLNGSYEALDGGTSTEALATLTGYPCESITFEKSQSYPHVNAKNIWPRFLNMWEKGFLMATLYSQRHLTSEVFLKYGLIFNHEYSVLDVCELKNNRLVRLRDPHGRSKWNGEWSYDSSKWTPRLRRKLGEPTPGRHKPNKAESYGLFWMSFNDFLYFFESVTVCKTSPNWFESRSSGYFSPEGARNMIAFTLTVSQTCEIDMDLFHNTNKNRSERATHDLCVSVFRISDNRSVAGGKLVLGKLAVSTYRRLCKSIHCEHVIEPGEYLIVPFSFNFWYTVGVRNFYNLVLHSSQSVSVGQEIFNVRHSNLFYFVYFF